MFPTGGPPQITGAPVGHFIGMLNAFMVPLLRDAAVNLIDVWDPGEVLRMMREEGLGVGGGATYFLTSLLDHPDFTPEHLALIPFAGLGGSAVPAAVTRRATDLGIKAFRSYGSTEHPSITGSLLDDPEVKRLTTDGRALPGVELRLDDDGQILSRGPDCFVGYIDPELTAAVFDEGGWYHTGDVGVLDDDGYLTITDRISDIIIRGGENISAAEIEELMMGLTGVAEVCVVAGPRPTPGRAGRRRHPGAGGDVDTDHPDDPGPPGRVGAGQTEVARVPLPGGRVPEDAVGQGAEVRPPTADPGGPAEALALVEAGGSMFYCSENCCTARWEPVAQRHPPTGSVPPRPGERIEEDLMVAESDQPRVVPLAPSAWPKEMREALAAMRPPNPRHPLPSTEGRPKGLNALGTLAYHPELARAFHTFVGHLLFASTLSPRQRELLVLRVAAVRDADYEWRQHVVLASDVGITAEEVTRIAEGPDAAGWSPVDRAMVSAVDELLAGAMVAPGTWETLAAELDVQQLLDLVFTVGAYDALAMAFRSFGVPLDDDLR